MTPPPTLVPEPPAKSIPANVEQTTPTPFSRIRWSRSVILIAVAGLLLRVAWILISGNTSIGTWVDEGAGIAVNMLSGKGYVYQYGTIPPSYSFRVPVFPLTLFAIWKVFGQNLLLTKLLMAISSFGSIIFAGLIARKMFDRRAGLIAAGLVAVFPTVIYWAGMLGPETLTTFLLLLLLLLLLEEHVFAAGLAMGLLALTRGVFLPFAAIAALYIVFRSVSWKSLSQAAIFCLAAGIAMTPWIYRNWRVHHSPLLLSTEGGLVFYETNNRLALADGGDWDHDYDFYDPSLKKQANEMSEIAFDHLLYERGLQDIGTNLVAFGHAFKSRVFNLWRPSPRENYPVSERILMFVTWLPVVLLALYQMYSEAAWRRWDYLLLVGVLLLVTISYGFFYAVIRYRAPLEPIVLILAAGGLSHLWARRLLRRV